MDVSNGGCRSKRGARGDGGLEVLGRLGPLGEPLAFAFKAGFHDNEQIWLRGEEGALLRISTWEVDPRYADTCAFGGSSAGYRDGFGRFGPLQLVRGEELLLFTESLACDHGAQSYPSRVLAHDLASGETRVLLETDARPNVVVSEQTAVVLLRHVPLTSPSQAAQPGDVQLYELVDGALAPISLPDVDRWLRLQLSPPARLLRWTDRVLLLAPGLPALEKVGSTWRASDLAEPFDDADFGIVAESPSGTRLCAATSRTGEPVVARLLDTDGRWTSATLDGVTWIQGCLWSPDETRVAFDSHVHELDPSGLVPLEVSVPRPAGSWRGALYAPGAEGDSIVRVDWATLEMETVVTGQPRLCPGDASSRLFPYVPPDDRPLAILKESCGCIDCDISGSFAWNAETGALEIVEEPFGEHQVYRLAWLRDGGAVILSTQAESSFPRDGIEQRPPAGSYFAVAADGKVEQVGPLPRVEGALHAPLSP